LTATADALHRFGDRPVALCWGERDWCFTPEFRAEWERRFPRAQVTRCEDAGHYVFEEAPGEVERALADLLAQSA
jgi:haloalkane dehalogenase